MIQKLKRTQAGVAVAHAVEHVGVWQLACRFRHLQRRLVILQGRNPVAQAFVCQTAACREGRQQLKRHSWLTAPDSSKYKAARQAATGHHVLMQPGVHGTAAAH